MNQQANEHDTESQALVKSNGDAEPETITTSEPFTLVPRSLSEAKDLATLLSKSALIPKQFHGKPADIFVAEALQSSWMAICSNASDSYNSCTREIARAFISDPVILVADEPTGDLDRTSAGEILAILDRLNKEMEKTIIMVTHDPHAAKTAHLIRHLEKGELDVTN